MAMIKKHDAFRSSVTVFITTSLLNRLYEDPQEPRQDTPAEPNLDTMLELEIQRTLNILGR